ncbi:MAG: DegV family protein [Anaerotruncus sp.]|nr:DegV family protein [Anaerotruncus sp.]
MAKKATNDQKILLMTDTASDIPDADLTAGKIAMLPIPIAIEGKDYLERVDFTIPEFYERLAAAKEIPTTSHILSTTYLRAYEDAMEQGYTHIINTTITSRGSNMFEAAVLAKRQFREAHPDSVLEITVLDSGTYTVGYGYPIIEASKMVQAGKTASEIISYLDDYYSTAEIYFAAYSLEYVKKSGRVPAAAAFVGDVLGLRPIISIIDGKTTTVEKVRGDKNIVPHIVDHALARTTDKKAPVVVVYGAVEQYRDEMAKEVAKRFGHQPKLRAQVGAAIAINAGPKIVGVIVRGEKRLNTRARESDYLT